MDLGNYKAGDCQTNGDIIPHVVHDSETAFFIKNVKNSDKLNVHAPTLHYKVFKNLKAPKEIYVKCFPEKYHDVKICYFDDPVVGGQFNMKNPVKGLVSKKKVRYTEGDVDLDLTYVAERVIAMGWPSEKFEAFYRNRGSDVLKFLDERHENHYKVYNLCSERRVNILFSKLCEDYRFPDHNVPTLDIILRFCQDAYTFLKESNENVIVIHCKAGKGRTGLMVSSFLGYNKNFDMEGALKYFGDIRTYNGKGVTIPSQIRFTSYFQEYINDIRAGKAIVTPTLLLKEVKIFVGNGRKLEKYFLSVDALEGKFFELDETSPNTTGKIFGDHIIKVAGNFKVKVFDKNKKILFHFWLNTMYAKMEIQLQKSELDGAAKNKNIPEDFGITLHLEHVPGEDTTESIDDNVFDTTLDLGLKLRDDLKRTRTPLAVRADFKGNRTPDTGSNYLKRRGAHFDVDTAGAKRKAVMFDSDEYDSEGDISDEEIGPEETLVRA